MSDIIALLKNREEKGLSLLYDSYAPALLGIIVRIVKNDKIGEEILQQSFLKIWNNIHSYDRTRGNFFTWMAAIARNTAIDQIRLRGYQEQQNVESLDPKSYQYEYVLAQTDNIDTESLLQRLDAKYKSVLDLIYLQGYTHQDAATVLEIPLGTVKTRLRFAIRILREELKGERDLFIGLFGFITFLILVLWM